MLVVVDSQDYPSLLEFLKGNTDDQQFRRKLAWKAFQHVAAYDSAVSEWLWKQTEGGTLFFMIDIKLIQQAIDYLYRYKKSYCNFIYVGR